MPSSVSILAAVDILTFTGQIFKIYYENSLSSEDKLSTIRPKQEISKSIGTNENIPEKRKHVCGLFEMMGFVTC